MTRRYFTVYTSDAGCSDGCPRSAIQIAFTVLPIAQQGLFKNVSPVAWKVLNFEGQVSQDHSFHWESDLGFCTYSRLSQRVQVNSSAHVPPGHCVKLQSNRSGHAWTHSMPHPEGGQPQRIYAKNASGGPKAFALSFFDTPNTESTPQPIACFRDIRDNETLIVNPSLELQAYLVTGFEDNQVLTPEDTMYPLMTDDSGGNAPISINDLPKRTTCRLFQAKSGQIRLHLEEQSPSLNNDFEESIERGLGAVAKEIPSLTKCAVSVEEATTRVDENAMTTTHRMSAAEDGVKKTAYTPSTVDEDALATIHRTPAIQDGAKETVHAPSAIEEDAITIAHRMPAVEDREETVRPRSTVDEDAMTTAHQMPAVEDGEKETVQPPSTVENDAGAISQSVVQVEPLSTLTINQVDALRDDDNATDIRLQTVEDPARQLRQASDDTVELDHRSAGVDTETQAVTTSITTIEEPITASIQDQFDMVQSRAESTNQRIGTIESNVASIREDLDDSAKRLDHDLSEDETTTRLTDSTLNTTDKAVTSTSQPVDRVEEVATSNVDHLETHQSEARSTEQRPENVNGDTRTMSSDAESQPTETLMPYTEVAERPFGDNMKAPAQRILMSESFATIISPPIEGDLSGGPEDELIPRREGYQLPPSNLESLLDRSFRQLEIFHRDLDGARESLEVAQDMLAERRDESRFCICRDPPKGRLDNPGGERFEEFTTHYRSISEGWSERNDGRPPTPEDLEKKQITALMKKLEELKVWRIRLQQYRQALEKWQHRCMVHRLSGSPEIAIPEVPEMPVLECASKVEPVYLLT